MQAGLLCYEAFHTGVTVDEPAHLVSSILYWHGRDVLLPRDMPPLLKIVAGAIPRPTAIGLDVTTATPDKWEWDFANEIMHRDHPEWIGPVFALARLPLLIFPLLSTLLIFFWARPNLGVIPALVAAAVFAFDPTSLGHGALIKNDHAATFAYLLFAVAVWHYFQIPVLSRLALLTFAAWLALSAKLSLAICFPAAILLIPLALPNRRGVGHLALFLAGFFAGCYAASVTDLAPLTAHDLAHSSIARLLPASVSDLLAGCPVPRLYWNGIDALLFWNAEPDKPVYFLGQHLPGGSPWYFLVAALVKTPEAFLFLLLAGLLRVHALGPRLCLFLLLPPVFYLVAASSTSMQLGLRLVLPALPFAALLAGSAFLQWRLWPLWTALTISLLTTAANFPNGIGFFNLSSGGTAGSLRYLAGSNVDWGQDLPALRSWADATRPPLLKLCYFGNDNPFRLFTDREIDVIPPPWGPDLVHSDQLRPEPGYYVISANLLPGHMFAPRFRNYFSAFRQLRPLRILGSSLYVYQIPAAGLDPPPDRALSSSAAP